MFRVYKRATPAVVASLLPLPTWKIDFRDRSAMDPRPFDDPAEAAEIRGIAQRQTSALRLGPPSTGGGGSCR